MGMGANAEGEREGDVVGENFDQEKKKSKNRMSGPMQSWCGRCGVNEDRGEEGRENGK